MLLLTLRTVFKFKREDRLWVQSLCAEKVRPPRRTAFAKASKYQPLFLHDQQIRVRIPRLKRNASTFELLLCNLKRLTEADRPANGVVIRTHYLYVKDIQCDRPQFGDTVALPATSR